MTARIKYQEEIAASLLAIQKTGKVSWNDFLTDSREFILRTYQGEDVTIFKRQWRHRFLNTASLLKLDVLPNTKDSWQEIETSIAQQPVSTKSAKSSTTSSSKSSSASSTSSTSTKNCILSAFDLLSIEAKFDAIDDDEKWILSTGTVVEDTMKSLAMKCKYEHPVHSLILDPSDDTWKDYFTEDELNEIRLHNCKTLPPFPSEYQQYLDTYDKNLTAKAVYQQSCSHFFDPIEEHDKKWMQQSLMMASNLFLYNHHLRLNDYSEADLLHKVWSFLYNLFNDNVIDAKLGEQCSVATTKRRNSKRRLEAVQARSSRMMGSRVDILFSSGSKELGCVEVAKPLSTNVDDKYMDDGMIKMPKSLRDMLSCLLENNLEQVNQVAIVGFLIMGMELELVIMDVPTGHSICRISRSEKFTFPDCIDTFATDLIPILEIIWKGKQMMINTIHSVNKRKRKQADMITRSYTITLSPSFTRQTSPKS